MAESSSEPAAAADLLIEPTLNAETVSKELIVATAMEVPGGTPGSDIGAEVPSSNGDADSPVPAKALKEEEAMPMPPQSLPLSSGNGTVTTVAAEEKTVSALLRHIETEGGQDRGGDPGLDLDLEDSSSIATAGGSEDQRESTDSASFSIPSLELSDGVTATGNSLDVEDGLSSSFSALGAEGCSPSAEVPGLKDTETPEAAGGAVAAAAAPPAAAAAAASAAAAPEPGPSMPVYYLVKWITWKEKKTPIITQSENGPCPLLAIMNTLFLRWKAKLPAQTEVVTTEDLMAHLGECVLSVTPREKADGMELNFQQNMSDAMAVLPKLSTGLDVNVRFTGVTDFEYTPECIVFDLLDIALYHGWLVDPQSPEMVAAVGKLSYNQLVEKIIDYKHSADSSRVSEGLVAEQFLESTATQLSYHGLCELNTTAKEGEISVFFRNNHFSTMIKHKGHLYLLVTDQGFLQEEGLVWESLHNVEGDGNFCDSDFRLCHQRAPPTSNLPPSAQDQQRQIDQDYLVAVSLQQQQGGAPGPLSDLELARQLQQEEYQQQQQLQQQQQQQQQQGSVPAAQQVRGQGSQQARRRDKDSDCVLL
ncbi:ubiquitin carboxyl-terminal hydrolase MINDY-1 [Xiphias gladius]|uniref:ubiquitin carboxyl-terminal hydrolase MINDY-1 n=1 Tax=Xiphias gladius TaxID=8245 RepID=UPI001A983A5B|nr:ubiquitin carboxyl-terminal hydrolase MINDY-1 [Xiphias gladius]XP_039978072.1 ubiquitin carboxyl-terminal hydrolase MINDY-1 [Xiphias gladius]XP_039978073.1 ubiquitin carboxyl-terminal hydrolase MINDY-1 [Xiphias gladius]XP_039978074.1 ubiquitin carboxyl-terminal hydrolase MINDY-1 [Xiphias gladius]XP_039978075.1 ubiquitin carboxyl-terminal hydrolase MINDY-1 [Xiphias gladius]XP_039978076.1 ubiquitin carboxyl-terminal hydrolase MINDY-1 [Xiphias gladius]XP_039978077.1 ubiquitin carboxyl-termina